MQNTPRDARATMATERRTRRRRLLRRITRYAFAAIAAGVVGLLAWCLIPLHSSNPRIEARSDTQYWLLANGHRIAYSRVDARDAVVAKAPIVFVHGGPGAYVHSSTIATLGALADGGRDVYFYDQAGSGLSDRLPHPLDHSFPGNVEDLLEIVTKKIGAPRVVLIGQSFGGRLAAAFAIAHPELIERLVLCAPAAIEPVLYDADGENAALAAYPIPPGLVFTLPPGFAARAPGLWSGLPVRAVLAVILARACNVKLMSDLEADGVMNDLAVERLEHLSCDPANVPLGQGGAGFYASVSGGRCPTRCDGRANMSGMHAPVLVLHGQCDPIVSYAEAYEYAALFPSAEYRPIPGAGHVVWWDEPESVVAQIAEFLEGATSASAP
ncbi:MAG: alpha/beta hydrolase [Phycisphaerae bacterium]|nr:alpha/beta hydrolase [Phycisphaerae bacterium]